MMDKLVLVHLSDIHFTGASGRSVHDLDTEVRNEVVRDAQRLIAELGGATGVLVTGDIAFSGKREQYERAASWLVDLCKAIGCREESVWVVPGNHDVDRDRAKSKLTRMLHESIRAKSEATLDAELRDIFSDPQTAGALIDPLTDYNAFAARFECTITTEKPFWERDLMLSCGTILRLRGLCSALVCNAEDAKGNIVLGAAQASVSRIDGVEYVTLCHHPPDWLRDHDTVVTQLESKVRLQLFGHKHAQRVQEVNGMLRVTAGAMHPERGERDWDPMYNVFEIARLDDQRLGVHLFQRRWHKTELRFVPDGDSYTGKPHREYIWNNCPRPVRKELRAVEAPMVTTPQGGVSGAVAAAETTEKDSEVMPPNYERRLTYRFLTLPFRHQIAVANSLNVLTDEDRALNDEALFHELFRRALAGGLLGKLWEETEKRHADPAPFNPFGNTK